LELYRCDFEPIVGRSGLAAVLLTTVTAPPRQLLGTDGDDSSSGECPCRLGGAWGRQPLHVLSAALRHNNWRGRSGATGSRPGSFPGRRPAPPTVLHPAPSCQRPSPTRRPTVSGGRRQPQRRRPPPQPPTPPPAPRRRPRRPASAVRRLRAPPHASAGPAEKAWTTRLPSPARSQPSTAVAVAPPPSAGPSTGCRVGTGAARRRRLRRGGCPTRGRGRASKSRSSVPGAAQTGGGPA